MKYRLRKMKLRLTEYRGKMNSYRLRKMKHRLTE
jgi:hypothetical protein